MNLTAKSRLLKYFQTGPLHKVWGPNSIQLPLFILPSEILTDHKKAHKFLQYPRHKAIKISICFKQLSCSKC